MDVELTSDLDLLLQDDIGFVIPVDEVSSFYFGVDLNEYDMIYVDTTMRNN